MKKIDRDVLIDEALGYLTFIYYALWILQVSSFFLIWYIKFQIQTIFFGVDILIIYAVPSVFNLLGIGVIRHIRNGFIYASQRIKSLENQVNNIEMNNGKKNTP